MVKVLEVWLVWEDSAAPSTWDTHCNYRRGFGGTGTGFHPRRILDDKWAALLDNRRDAGRGSLSGIPAQILHNQSFALLRAVVSALVRITS